MLGAATVALATLQHTLVALEPSVPNLGSVEAARFLSCSSSTKRQTSGLTHWCLSDAKGVVQPHGGL